MTYGNGKEDFIKSRTLQFSFVENVEVDVLDFCPISAARLNLEIKTKINRRTKAACVERMLV